MKKLFFLLLLAPLLTFGRDSCSIRISLLTVTPGAELYSTFGHSALRVTDSLKQIDIVYNYGTFNFDEPGFYMKFVRGKLMYFVSIDYYQSFADDARMENRGITEQLLNLSCAEKQKVIEFLHWNMAPENRNYKYDFTFDNCTTRLRDLIIEITDSAIVFHPVNAKGETFRDAIHHYLDRGDKPWSKLGIDLLLGSSLDRPMTHHETMFLPDNLMEGFDNASLYNQPLVEDKEVVVSRKYVHQEESNLTSPLFIFSCLFVLLSFLSFSKNTGVQRFMNALDGVLFFLTGLLGFLVIFMWLGTDHYMTKDNYNLLWAWPFHAIAAFYIHSKYKWAKIYFGIYAVFGILLLLAWFFLAQQLNTSLIPIVGILIVRSFMYISSKRK